jgi:hypothetical protein
MKPIALMQATCSLYISVRVAMALPLGVRLQIEAGFGAAPRREARDQFYRPERGSRKGKRPGGNVTKRRLLELPRKRWEVALALSGGVQQSFI